MDAIVPLCTAPSASVTAGVVVDVVVVDAAENTGKMGVCICV